MGELDYSISTYDYLPLFQDFDCDNLTSCSNETFEYFGYTESAINPEGVVIPVVFGSILILGLVGNGLVIYVILRNRPMKTVTNLYLVNMAFADMLFLCLCLPFTALLYTLPSWPFGEVVCKMVNYMMMVTMSTSIFTLMAVGIDRYYAIMKPIRSRSFRNIENTTCLLVLIWVLSLVAMSPIPKLSRLVMFLQNGETRAFCAEHWEHISHRRAFSMSIFVIMFLLPMLIIAICYFKMAKNLLTSVGPGVSIECNISAFRVLRSRRKIARMVFVVVILFVTCWMPLHVVHLWFDFGKVDHITSEFDIFKIVAHCMSYLGSVVNPFVYCFMSHNFRKCFKQAFKCGKLPNGQIFVVTDPERVQPHSNDLTPENSSRMPLFTGGDRDDETESVSPAECSTELPAFKKQEEQTMFLAQPDQFNVISVNEHRL
ncbi:unnamed protein product [Owenia fusiformis]|uniref:G-protein coupled receptors family 1 profile domain-containing protein n=1 Tax=Owenia fusiformis TaxID=6347 RepID=A0A8S4NXV3_OWEFU|nr:unnamed protein product [Owenia fusiformis]